MKKFTRIFIRPHTEVDFYQPSKEFLDHMQTTYIDTGKCLKLRERSYKDANELVLELISEWTDESDPNWAITDSVWAEELEKEIQYNKDCEILLLDKSLVNE